MPFIAFLSPALAQPHPQPHSQPAPHAAQPSAPDPRPAPTLAPTRAEVAAHYLDFDLAFAAYLKNKPEDSAIADVNRTFDALTMKFFGGDYGGAIAGMNSLSAMMAAGRKPGVQTPPVLAGGLSIRLDKPVWWPAREGDAPRVQLKSFGQVTRRDLNEVTLLVRVSPEIPTGKPDEKKPEPIATKTHKIKAAPGSPIDLDMPLWEFAGDFSRDAAARETRWSIDIEVDGFCDQGHATFISAKGSLAATRDANRQTLDHVLDDLKIDPAHAPAIATPLATPLAVCRARNELLSDEPSPARSAEFLLVGPVLAADISAEIESLGKGVDPYRGRVGDMYTPIVPNPNANSDKKSDTGAPADSNSGPRSIVPCRVYAPSDDRRQVGAMGLLILLHGAGGDESMFFDGLGAGIVKSLADKHHLILAAPATLALGGSVTLDALIKQVSSRYAIDPKRIYVLGHSLGAGAAASLARTRADTLAAVVCIAGGGTFRPNEKATRPLAPSLVIGAELDPLGRADMLQRGVGKAKEIKLPVEMRLIKNYGHTLVVGASLPEAVEWLLKHKLEDAKPVEIPVEK